MHHFALIRLFFTVNRAMDGERFGKKHYNMKESWAFGHSKQLSLILYGVSPIVSPYIDRFTVKIVS